MVYIAIYACCITLYVTTLVNRAFRSSPTWHIISDVNKDCQLYAIKIDTENFRVCSSK